MTGTALSLWLLILAAPPAGSIAGPSIEPAGELTEVFALHSEFGAEEDRNRDGWPDGWRRLVGPGFPRYVTMSRSDDASAPGRHSFRVELNGGGATAYSPAIEVSPAHVLTITVAVKTDKLQHDRAYISLRLLDAEEKLV